MNTHILIVEDNSLTATTIKYMLESLGYIVLGLVDSGEKALDMLHNIIPDIILMDIELAGELDGIDTSVKIKEKFDIPIIFTTAFDDQTILERAKITNPFGYILKPYRARELHIIIEVALFRYNHEKEFINREKRFRMLSKNSYDITMILNTNFHIDFESAAVEQLLEYKQGNRIGNSLFKFIHPDDVEITKESLNKVIKDPENVVTFECKMMTNNKSYIIIEAIATNHINEPSIEGIVLNARDITARKAAEEERLQAIRQRDESALALAATASHEMNQPLMILQGNIELFEMQMLKIGVIEKNNHYVGNIKNSLLRMQSILKKFRDAQVANFDTYSEHTEMIVFKERAES